MQNWSFIYSFVYNFSEVWTSFHATVICVSEKLDKLLVLERTYVSIAALKPLERKIFQIR